MKIENGNKNFELCIDSYEFPFDKKAMVEDNNWLNIKLVWEDDVLLQEGIVPCLTTYEVNALLDGMHSVLNQTKQDYESKFMEPNLNIRIRQHEGAFAFYMSFLMKHHNDPFVFVKYMEYDELHAFIMDLESQMKKFSVR